MIGTITIGTEPTEIFASDGGREELVIQNTSDAPVYIGDSESLTVDNGIKIGVGDSISMSIQQNNKGSFGMVQNSIYGIASVAGKIVRVMAQ